MDASLLEEVDTLDSYEHALDGYEHALDGCKHGLHGYEHGYERHLTITHMDFLRRNVSNTLLPLVLMHYPKVRNWPTTSEWNCGLALPSRTILWGKMC